MKNFICTILSIMCLIVFSSATIVIKDSEVTVSNETAGSYDAYIYEAVPGQCACGLYIPNGRSISSHALFRNANNKPILLSSCGYGNEKTNEFTQYSIGGIRVHASYCNYYQSGGRIYYDEKRTYVTYDMDYNNPISQLNLRNCIINSSYTTSGALISVSYPSTNVTITGGKYSGAPALDSDKITITKGTITDNKSSRSTYLLGEDSEETVVVDNSSGGASGTTTVTTVKLSNPPVIIDWSEFPGIDD